MKNLSNLNKLLKENLANEEILPFTFELTFVEENILTIKVKNVDTQFITLSRIFFNFNEKCAFLFIKSLTELLKVLVMLYNSELDDVTLKQVIDTFKDIIKKL